MSSRRTWGKRKFNDAVSQRLESLCFAVSEPDFLTSTTLVSSPSVPGKIEAGRSPSLCSIPHRGEALTHGRDGPAGDFHIVDSTEESVNHAVVAGVVDIHAVLP
jgi:hypothetical protein